MEGIIQLLDLKSRNLSSSANTFNPQEKFIVGGNVDGVSISAINNSFLVNYIPKIETSIPEGNLEIYRLGSGIEVTDTVIIQKLISKANYSLEFNVTLFHIWELLSDQPNGQEGKLATGDGEKNIFFSENMKGIVMPIQIYWKEEKLQNSGWVIESYPESVSFKNTEHQKIVSIYNKIRDKNDQIFSFQKAA